jgi:lipoprotein-releasing system ATP-binding protein
MTDPLTPPPLPSADALPSAPPPSRVPPAEPATDADRAGIVIEARGVRKEYPGGDGGIVRVLAGADLAVRRGEMVAIVGASGSGKSTFLHVLGGLERPTAGTVLLDGTPVEGLDDDRLAALRNRTVGFVFQFHHLLREFSALENVMLPLRIGGQPVPVAAERAADLLARVGMAQRMHHRPAELSGGEQQRAAVARALAAGPAVLLADEPSGNLDHGNAERLHDLFATLARELGLGLVVVTHNLSLAARADRVLALEDGRLVTSPRVERVG